MKNEITNTAAQASSNPEVALLDAMIQGSSGAIEHSEARGQQELVKSDVLPVRGTDGQNAQILERLGVKLGEPVPGDELFRYAVLPPGWKKVATEHAMWSHLVDDRGRVRAAIFYKAAFYDRRANLRLETRLQIHDECTPDYKKSRGLVKDGEKVLFTTEWLERGAFDVASRWLAEHYPDYRDPSAYWENLSQP